MGYSREARKSRLTCTYCLEMRSGAMQRVPRRFGCSLPCLAPSIQEESLPLKSLRRVSTRTEELSPQSHSRIREPALYMKLFTATLNAIQRQGVANRRFRSQPG